MIISITPSKKNKIKIYADGEFQFTVESVIWYSSRFHEGDLVTSEELDLLKQQSDLHEAFESGLRMLSLRAHSRYELKVKLEHKYPKDAVVAALEKLEGTGLIDDEKFAALLAAELYEKKRFAPPRILSELKNRGLSSEIAQNAVNSLDIDKESGIIKVIEKAGLTSDSSPKEKNRIIRRLMSMGYSYSEISKYIYMEQDM